MPQSLLPLERILASREAGAVQRVHTLPHHGSYSVGEHSYNMATMLAVLHPNPSAALLIAALWHDAGERWAGDVPAPAKWAAGYDFNVLLENIELRATGKYNLLAPRELHSEEIQWIHAVDYLEFLLWCYEQKNMGNRNIEPCIRAIEVYFQTHKKEIPEICFNLMVELFEGGWRRLEDKI